MAEHGLSFGHRSRLLNLPIGSTVTEEVIARLMGELIKGSSASARVIPLIDKVDVPRGRAEAEKLARHLLSLDPPGIRRVVPGRLQHTPAVTKIVQA